MEPARLHRSRREKSRKLAKYLQLEEKAKKLQKKPHLHGEERFGYAETGSSNKPRHSSDSRDRSQPRRGRSGGENLPSYLRSREEISDIQRNCKRTIRKPLPRDSSDEELWERLDSEKMVERIISGRIINQYTPSESDSDSQRLGPKFTQVDVNLEKGMGDEPLPHAVPIVGLRSARTARSTNSNSGANSSKPYSVGITHRSTNTGASAKASSRSLSTGSVRNSSHLPTSRPRIVSSTRIMSAPRNRFSSESTDETISPRTYQILSPGTKILQEDKSSRTARSSRSATNLLSDNVSPRSGRGDGQLPGFWVNVSEDRKSNSNNLFVWAIADPPQLPPGIVWEKVSPPTSPVPISKEVAVESAMSEIDDEGKEKENEPHDVAQNTSIHVIPELTPSLDPSVIVPKTVIRKVMTLPENVGYPGFCEPTEAKLKQKSKIKASKEIMGENNSAVSKHKEQLKSKKMPNSKKEQPQKAAAHAHKVSKRSGITPSSWRAGLKCVRRELGPWKARVSSDDGRSSGNQENSETYEKLNDICKFAEMTENKISEYKTSKTRPDSELTKVHLYHKESGESKKLEMEQCAESNQNKEMNNLIDEPKSLDIQQVTRDVSPEKESEIISKKNNESSLILNDLVKADNSSRKSQKKINKRSPGVKSAHNLNNAFITDNAAILPKKANSQFNLPTDSKGESQSKCALRHYDPTSIKEYIRIQKKQRHVKLLEEKEKKKMQEEYRKAKLQELRSKSRELVEESLKKKPKYALTEFEFLQIYGKQLDELASTINFIEKRIDVQPVSNNCVPTEKKSSSQGDSTHSNLTTNSQNSLRVKMPEKLDICLPTEIKLDSAGTHPAEDRVPKKSLQHIALQTDEASPCIVEPILPICEAKAVEKATSMSEKSGSSKTDSDKIVIDKELCHSIHSEMKKLTHNVYMLEKQRMIGVLQEKGAIPSTSAQGGVLTRKSLEVGDLLMTDLNNKKISTLGGERLSIIRNDSPSEVVFPVQSHGNPLCTSLMPHTIVELPARTKPSVNSVIRENQIGCNLIDDVDASLNMQKCILTGKERKSTSKNNISSNLLDIKHNYTSVSDSIISEGPLSEDELANLARLKEPEANNLHENAQCKNLDEKKEDEIPLWLKKPPMESHPFNFISAVKMKLKRFLEEQNKNILTDISSNAIQIPRTLDMTSDDKKEESGKEYDVVGDGPEVNYESDFEPSVASGSGPSQNDEKVSAANSSDLDTATEDILPTDEVPESKIPFPNNDARNEAVDYISDNISELSRKSGSPPTVTQRKTLGEESILGFNEVISSVSTMQLDKVLSDGSRMSSKDELLILFQLQSFKKVKQLPKKNSVPEDSFTSSASEARSSTSEGKSVNTSDARKVRFRHL